MKTIMVVLMSMLVLGGCNGTSEKVDDASNNTEESIENELSDEVASVVEEPMDVLTIEKVSDVSYPDPKRDDIVEIYVDLKNNTDKAVKWFSVAVMTFDRDGYPLVTETGKNQYDLNELHGAIVWCDGAITIKEQSTLEKQPWWFYGENVAYVEVVVENVEYHDGTLWSNPNLKEILSEKGVLYK